MLYFFTEFTALANITYTARGFPRIVHDGYSYGMRKEAQNNRNQARWVCTGTEVGSRKRCVATIQSKVIGGRTMVCVRKQNHICVKPITKILI